VRTSRTAIALLLLSLGSLLAAGAVAHADTPSPKPTGETSVELVQPVSKGGLAAGYKVVRTVPGGCGRGSFVAPGDVYRCGFEPHRIIDPCLPVPLSSGKTANSVVCPRWPWSHQLVRLTLKRPLQLRPARHVTYTTPWGLSLAGGVNCVAAGGAVASFHGRPAYFECPGHHLAVLLGLDRRQQPWTAFAAHEHNKPPYFTDETRVVVSTVYYLNGGVRLTHGTLPFTGPTVPVVPAAAVGVLLVFIGLAIRRLSRAL